MTRWDSHFSLQFSDGTSIFDEGDLIKRRIFIYRGTTTEVADFARWQSRRVYMCLQSDFYIFRGAVFPFHYPLTFMETMKGINEGQRDGWNNQEYPDSQRGQRGPSSLMNKLERMKIPSNCILRMTHSLSHQVCLPVYETDNLHDTFSLRNTT
jgi:hypothetical protein